MGGLVVYEWTVGANINMYVSNVITGEAEGKAI